MEKEIQFPFSIFFYLYSPHTTILLQEFQMRMEQIIFHILKLIIISLDKYQCCWADSSLLPFV